MEKKPAAGACAFCRKRKRKCDGKVPCAMCLRYNRAGECEYPVDKDRRKWKFDSTYVDYLELRADLLEQLVDGLIRQDPAKAQAIGVGALKQSHVMHKQNAINEQLVKNLADKDAIDELVNTKWRVRQQQGRTEFYGPVSGRQQVSEQVEEENQFVGPSNKLDMVSSSPQLRLKLIEDFKKSFSHYFLISWQTLDEVKQWEYPSNDVSKELLMCAIFAYGAVFNNHKDLAFIFLQEAEMMSMKSSRNINEYVLQAFLILSCVQLGMGLDANSWTFCAMSSAMTQYMGLHLQSSQQTNSKDQLIPYRGKSLAMFWSIILQDRIITSVLGRGCRIQYFRVKTDFYEPSLVTQDLDEYITEGSFAFHTKLWFIHDKFLSQIYSSKAEFLHKSHRLILIQQGVEALKDLQDSLPGDFKLSSTTLDNRILILHLSFSVAYLLLHRAYLNQMPLKVINTMMQQCEIACNIISKITPQFRKNEDIPYFASYLILTCATFDLFLMTNKNESLKAKIVTRLGLYIESLLVIGKFWRRGLKDIQVLIALAKRWNLHLPFLESALDQENDNDFLQLDQEFSDSFDTNYFMNQFSFDT
jgi:hypothetical protein